MINQKTHWDKTAPTYNEEILDVFKSDKNGKLLALVKKFANKKHTAIDFGAGNGKGFELLASRFKNIIALDISQNLLNQAKARQVNNVTFKRLDLSRRNIKLPKVEFVFSCNVIMLPQLEKNLNMLQNIRKAMVRKGNAVIVLPSVESAMYSSIQLINAYKKDGVKLSEVPKDEIMNYYAPRIDIAQGVIHIHKVPTKHYCAPEIEYVLKEAGLTVSTLDKIEYDWNTEIISPPKWLKDPYPWDWVVECRPS